MIYFDNSATTKPKKEVVDTFYKVAYEFFGNPSSIHTFGLQAERLLSQARKQMADLLKIKDTEIIFTSGGTEANNLAIKGVAKKYRSRGNHIITSAIEHPSVLEVCKQLEGEGYNITYLPVDSNGRVNPKDVNEAITNETILVSIMHINNEVGTIQPIKEIGDIVKNYRKILFHVDYVQGAGKVLLPFHEYHVDLASMSSHKFHGLKGTGALYVREGVKIAPLFGGGNQEKSFRSGTENVAGIVAMSKALRMSMDHLEQKVQTMNEIQNFIVEQLSAMPEVTINTPEENHAPHIVNFSVEGFKAEVLVHSISEQDVFVSTTSACSSKLNEPSKTLLGMGVRESLASSSIRISLSFDNTMEEAKAAVAAIQSSIEKLSKVMRRS